jgi:hypothetical protein
VRSILELLSLTHSADAATHSLRERVVAIVATLALHDAALEQSLMTDELTAEANNNPSSSPSKPPAATVPTNQPASPTKLTARTRFKSVPLAASHALDATAAASSALGSSRRPVSARLSHHTSREDQSQPGGGSYSVFARSQAPWAHGGVGLIRRQLLAAGAVPMLLETLRDAEAQGHAPNVDSATGAVSLTRSATVHTSTTAALMCMAATDPVPTWGRDELQQLLRLMGLGNPTVKLYCLTAVWSLAQDASNRKTLYELGTAGILMDSLYAWYAANGQDDSTVESEKSSKPPAKSAALQWGWEAFEWTAAALWQLMADVDLCRRMMASGDGQRSSPLHADDEWIPETLVRILDKGADAHRANMHMTYAASYANGLRMLLRCLLAVVTTVEGWAATFHALGGAAVLTRIAQAEDALPQLRGAAAQLHLQV